MAGLLLGGAMQPHLYEGDRPSGPQMFAAWAGARSTGPFDPGGAFAGYRGPAPDYVLGTDSKKTMAWPDERAAMSAPPREVAQNDDPPPEAPATLTRAAYEDPPAPAHAYPSLVGAQPAAADPTPAPASDISAPAVTG